MIMGIGTLFTLGQHVGDDVMKVLPDAALRGQLGDRSWRMPGDHPCWHDFEYLQLFKKESYKEVKEEYEEVCTLVNDTRQDHT